MEAPKPKLQKLADHVKNEAFAYEWLHSLTFIGYDKATGEPITYNGWTGEPIPSDKPGPGRSSGC